jgi:hypothetical protein
MKTEIKKKSFIMVLILLPSIFFLLFYILRKPVSEEPDENDTKLEILESCEEISSNEYECKVFINEYYPDSDNQCMHMILTSKEFWGQGLLWCPNKDLITWNDIPSSFRVKVPVTISIKFKEGTLNAADVEGVDINLMPEEEAWEYARNVENEQEEVIFFRTDQMIELEEKGYYVVTFPREDGTITHEHFAIPYATIKDYSITNDVATFIISFEQNGQETEIAAKAGELLYPPDKPEEYEPISLDEFGEILNQDITYQVFFAIEGEPELTESIVEEYLSKDSTEQFLLVNRLSPND